MTRENETMPRPCVALGRGREKAPPKLPYQPKMWPPRGPPCRPSQPQRRIAQLYDSMRLHEICRRQPYGAEPEVIKSTHQPLRVVGMDEHPHTEITCIARVAVHGDGVASDHQKTHLMGAQESDELAEVAVETHLSIHAGVGATTRQLRRARPEAVPASTPRHPTSRGVDDASRHVRAAA